MFTGREHGSYLGAREDGPCRRPVFTVVWTDHPSMRIVTDGDVIMFCTCKTPGIARVTNTSREHGCPRLVNTGSVYVQNLRVIRLRTVHCVFNATSAVNGCKGN